MLAYDLIVNLSFRILVAHESIDRTHTFLYEPYMEIRESGHEPDSIILPVVLPEEYNGKILLVSVSGLGDGKKVILRSGDLWHREILRNTETEIKTLGIENARVHELGGALVRFEPDGAITIYGASREFGACDKEFAAEMVRKAFPERAVKVKS